MKFSIRALTLATLLFLSACATEVGSVDVEGESQPRFVFDTREVSLVVVYRVPRKYINDGIPLDAIFKNAPDPREGLKKNTDVLWAVDGKHDASIPLTYGSLPEGMTELVPAKPLAENTVYFVCTFIGRNAYSFAGRNFVIRDGKTIQIQSHIDENTVKN